jgi:hypothetical protein
MSTIVIDETNNLIEITADPAPSIVELVSAGPQGPQGIQGPAGAQGPVGPQGPQGEPTDISGLVPYTGATTNVDLGQNSFNADGEQETFTVDDPTNGSIFEGTNNQTLEALGNTFRFRIHAYKDTPGGRVYSPNYEEVDYTDSFVPTVFTVDPPTNILQTFGTNNQNLSASIGAYTFRVYSYRDVGPDPVRIYSSTYEEISYTATQLFVDPPTNGGVTLGANNQNIEAIGNTFNFYVYAYKIVNGNPVYSQSFETITYSDPNDNSFFSLDLSWDAVTGADGYRIILDDPFNGYFGDYSIDTATNSYSDYDGSGAVNDSNVFPDFYYDPDPFSISLSWDAAVDADGYRIIIVEDNQNGYYGDWSIDTTDAFYDDYDGSAASFDSNVSPDTWSDQYFFSLSMTWDAVTDADGYKILVEDPNNGYTFDASLETTTNSYDDYGGTPDVLNGDVTPDSLLYTYPAITGHSAVIDNQVTASGFKTPTGTASQFLKANGSVDSSTYLTTETDTLQSVLTRGNTATSDMSTTGNVGIGATAGTNKLLVNQTANIDGALRVNASRTIAGANTIAEYYNNGILRSIIRPGGGQTWWLNSSLFEAGRIEYATPGNTPGIGFFSSTNQRTQLRLAPDGGFLFGFSATTSNPGDLAALVSSGTTPFGAFLGINDVAPTTICHFSTPNINNALCDIRLSSGDTTVEAGQIIACIETYHKDASLTSSELTKICTISESTITNAASVNGALRFSTTAANTPAERMRITSGGNVGINTTTPAARLDVDGTTKLGTSGAVFNAIFSATATLDFPSIGANSTEQLTMTVTGAQVGDSVHLGAPSTLESGLNFCGFVSAANTVTIRVHNSTGGSIDPVSATWRATVIDF